MTELEDVFEAKVRDAIAQCRQLGYHPNDFQQMLDSSSATLLARKLATSGDIQSGLKRLSSLGRLDLSIEHILLQTEFLPMFSKQVIAAARWRLEQVDRS